MARATRSEEAERDFDAIIDRMSGTNPEKAGEFAALVAAQCDIVAAHPKMGRSRESLRAGLRSFVVDRCVFFYRITDDGILIVRIIHGSQDADSIMRDE